MSLGAASLRAPLILALLKRGVTMNDDHQGADAEDRRRSEVTRDRESETARQRLRTED